MSTIRLRTPCLIRKRLPGWDLQGRATHGAAHGARCGIIKLQIGEITTSVRADTSASRGRSDQEIYDAELLVGPHTDIGLGDLIEVKLAGAPQLVFEVKSCRSRADVAGRLHHIQIMADRWASA